jgi:hypothetical protein
MVAAHSDYVSLANRLNNPLWLRPTPYQVTRAEDMVYAVYIVQSFDCRL